MSHRSFRPRSTWAAALAAALLLSPAVLHAAMLGDWDGDDIVEASDAQQTVIFSVGAATAPTPGTMSFARTDSTCDGDIDARDAVFALRRVGGQQGTPAGEGSNWDEMK